MNVSVELLLAESEEAFFARLALVGLDETLYALLGFLQLDRQRLEERHLTILVGETGGAESAEAAGDLEQFTRS